MIAALYVQTDGAYYGLEGVDPWDENRDARQYAGPHPVVAHPPCSTWCMLASVNEARWGSKIGDDGGCFSCALNAVRDFGGVLEHPAYTLAWSRYGLHRPTRGYWSRSLFDEGWVTEVSQSAYGHPARKRTWLYYVGANLPPALDWRDVDGEGVVGAGINSGQSAGRPRIDGHAASATPDTFRDALIEMAETAHWGVCVTEVTAALDALARNGSYDHGLKLTTTNLTYEQLEAVGFVLGQANRDVKLAMGDYLIIAEERFPEKFSQAAEALNISEDGLLEYLRVSRAVPHSVRVKHPKISWSHYRAVASLKVVDSKTGEVTTDHKAQKMWLEKAAENNWSHAKFRAELEPPEDDRPEEPNVCRCCHRPYDR